MHPGPRVAGMLGAFVLSGGAALPMLTTSTRPMTDDDRAAIAAQARNKIVPVLVVIVVLNIVSAIFLAVAFGLLGAIIVAVLHFVRGAFTLGTGATTVTRLVIAIILVNLLRSIVTDMVVPRRRARSVATHYTGQPDVRTLEVTDRYWFGIFRQDPRDDDDDEGSSALDEDDSEPDILVSPSADDDWLIIYGVDYADLHQRLRERMAFTTTTDGFITIKVESDGAAETADRIDVTAEDFDSIGEALAEIGPSHHRNLADLYRLPWDQVPEALRAAILEQAPLED